MSRMEVVIVLGFIRMYFCLPQDPLLNAHSESDEGLPSRTSQLWANWMRLSVRSSYVTLTQRLKSVCRRLIYRYIVRIGVSALHLVLTLV